MARVSASADGPRWAWIMKMPQLAGQGVELVLGRRRLERNGIMALTAEAAEIDWRCPGRSITGVLPLGAQVLPWTVSARNPDSSQK